MGVTLPEIKCFSLIQNPQSRTGLLLKNPCPCVCVCVCACEAFLLPIGDLFLVLMGTKVQS